VLSAAVRMFENPIPATRGAANLPLPSASYAALSENHT
jgi:hypothetical protein